MQLKASLVQTLSIAAVNDVNQRVCALVIVVPQSADFILPPHIPHCHVKLLVDNVFDVEANGWYRRYAFREFQRVEESSLTSCIKPEEQDPFFLQAGEFVDYRG